MKCENLNVILEFLIFCSEASSGNNDFDGSRSSAGSDSTSDCLRSGYTDPSGKNAG